MKIIDLDDPKGRLVEVYTLFWVDGLRSYLIVPYESYGGMMIVRENRADLVDSYLNGFVLRKDDHNVDMLIHWAADKDDLIYRLIDPPDPEAVAELYRRIREDKPPS